jgi:hypothetical protein
MDFHTKLLLQQDAHLLYQKMSKLEVEDMISTEEFQSYWRRANKNVQLSASGVHFGHLNAASFDKFLSSIYATKPNVRHIPLAWEDLHDLISNKLFNGTPLPEFEAASPYKVIDVKPLYGFLFREYIREYEFWAHVYLVMLLEFSIRRWITMMF